MLNLTNHEVMKMIYWCIAKVLDLLDPEKTNITQKVISAISALISSVLNCVSTRSGVLLCSQ